MRAFKVGIEVGIETAPFVTRSYAWHRALVIVTVVAAFVGAVFAFASVDLATDGPAPTTLALLLTGFIMLISSLRGRRRRPGSIRPLASRW